MYIDFIFLLWYNVIEFKIRGLISLKKKRISGFTLVELSVVIALLSIITTMVVSFTLLISRHVSDMSKNKDFHEELFYIENIIIDPWLNEFDNDYTIINSVTAGYNIGSEAATDIGANVKGALYKLTFDGNPKSPTYKTITAQAVGSKPAASYQCKYFTSMKVSVEKRTNYYVPKYSYCVIKIELNYRMSSDKNAETQTVVIVKAMRAAK